MGLFIAIMRRRELAKQKHEAEWQLTLITQAKRVACSANNDLMQAGTTKKTNEKMEKALQKRMHDFKVYEEKLDEAKAALQDQIKEIDAEIQSCQQMIDSHIQSSFSYQVGGR